MRAVSRPWRLRAPPTRIPQAVTDPLFRDSAFFDPNDLVQVKYEMLRSVEKDGRAVVEAAAGLRPVPTGLLCDARAVRPRGPARAAAPQARTEAPAQAHRRSPCRPGAGCAGGRTDAQAAQSWPRCLAERCGISAHPRSILRRLLPYLKRQEKKLPRDRRSGPARRHAVHRAVRTASLPGHRSTLAMLRGRDLGSQPRGVGLALLLREGMPGWLKAVDAVIRASAGPAEHRRSCNRRRRAPCRRAASRRRGCPACNATTSRLS